MFKLKKRDYSHFKVISKLGELKNLMIDSISWVWEMLIHHLRLILIWLKKLDVLESVLIETNSRTGKKMNKYC